MPNNVDSVIANEALQQTSAPPCSPRLFIYFSAPLQLDAKRLVIKIIKLMDQGPFLERPGKLTGPVSYFEVKVSRKLGCVLASNEVHFVSLAENFTV